MAKVNIDEVQEIASQLQISFVPTVVAFIEGRPVDAFAGVKTQSEIREFISKIAPKTGPSEIDQTLEFAEKILIHRNNTKKPAALIHKPCN